LKNTLLIILGTLLLSTLLVGCLQQTENISPSVAQRPQSDMGSISSPSYDELAKQGYLYPEMPRITCEDLKQQMDKGTDIVIIDTRDESVMMKGHLAGAIGIPDAIGMPGGEEMMDKQLETLPADKLKVFYCS
jgi:hypothetical protein